MRIEGSAGSGWTCVMRICRAGKSSSAPLATRLKDAERNRDLATSDSDRKNFDGIIAGIKEQIARQKESVTLAGLTSPANEGEASAVKRDTDADIGVIAAGNKVQDQKIDAKAAAESNRAIVEEAKRSTEAAQAVLAAHPELKIAFKGMANAQNKSAELIAELSQSTDAAVKAIVKRQEAAERALSSLKNTVKDTRNTQ